MRTNDERQARAASARVVFAGSPVTSLEFRDRVARRTRRAKAPISLGMLEPLEAYFRLLAQWNATINLTALPLDLPTDETFDRLLVVIPSSGLWASELSGHRLNLLNAQDNITAGVVIIRTLTRSARTEREAIAGYYQGLNSVQSNGLYPDTLQYVRSILALKAQM